MMLDRKFDTIRYLDIGGNLTDPMFKGVYNGVRKHEPDLESVLDRSWEHNLDKIMIPGISLQNSREALHLARADERLYCSVGCHSSMTYEFGRHNEDDYYDALFDLANKNKTKVKAVGDIGLDYHPDVLKRSDKKTQIKCFEIQLHMSHALKMPIFLHCQNEASKDMIKILKRYEGRLRGVIHSFNGSLQEAKKFEATGLHFGLSGCSLKTQENIDVVKTLPLNRLMISTNSPHCKMDKSFAGYQYVKTHAPARLNSDWSEESFVKGRSEPTHIIQVIEAVSAIKNFDYDSLALLVYQNAEKVLFHEAL